MISYHTSPLAALGKTRDAGGMNVYVRELARELSRGSIRVDILPVVPIPFPRLFNG